MTDEPYVVTHNESLRSSEWTASNQWLAKVHYSDGTIELSDSFREGLIAALVPVLVEAQKRATEQTS